MTRCTAIIPDLKMAYFKCLVCGAAPELTFVDRGQGLTLVHFSAQPQPFLTQNTPYTPPTTP